MAEPADNVVAAEERLADLFASADQIPEAPDFVKWVDRRFNSMPASEQHEARTTRR